MNILRTMQYTSPTRTVTAAAPDNMADEGGDGGTGMFAFVDGSKYVGQWIVKDDKRMRHGNGRFEDGTECYDGEWADDKMNGQGRYVFASKAVYDGSFVDNKFEGPGTYNWSDGATYTGQWRANKMHGKGCYTDPEQVKWEGKFYNGKFYNDRTYINLR